MSNELKKEVTLYYKKRLTPKQEKEELQKKAETSAKIVFDVVGWDYTKEKNLYKNMVDYLKQPGANSNVLIAEIIAEGLHIAIKHHLTEKPKPKKLPNIAVIGDFWELAPIETLLIWEGYDTENITGWEIDWNTDLINDCFLEKNPIPIKMIVGNSKTKSAQYHNHSSVDDIYTPLKASEPEKILQYIHDFNK